MIRVIRGLMWVDPEDKEEANANFEKVQANRFLRSTPPDRQVLEYLVEFFAKHGTAPSNEVVHDHFAQISQVDAQASVGMASTEIFYTGGDFAEIVEEVVEWQGQIALKETFETALEIADTGKEIGKETYRGINAAVAFASAEMQVPPPTGGGPMPADLREAEDALDALYQERKEDDSKAFGVPTGFRSFDQRTGFLKKKTLMIHAGYVGHLKSTSVMNAAVAAVCQNWSPLIFSAEMEAAAMLLLAVAIHSGHPKWGRPGFSYFAASMGRLDDTDEAFMKEVRHDLATNPDHGRIRIVDSSEFSTLGDIKHLTLKKHQQHPVDVVWIDYLTRMELDPKYARYDHTTGMNLTITEAKQWAMTFNGGEGMRVCMAAQVNREGFKRGQKQEGKLDETCLNQFNALEKEADYISYTWFDTPEKLASEPKFGLIKNRWGEVLYEPVIMNFNPDTRRVEEYVPTGLREMLLVREP